MQTHGELGEENFLPRRSEDSHCAFSGLFVLDGKELKPLTRMPSEELVNGWGGFVRSPWGVGPLVHEHSLAVAGTTAGR